MAQRQPMGRRQFESSFPGGECIVILLKDAQGAAISLLPEKALVFETRVHSSMLS
jgi:hypothetical protein